MKNTIALLLTFFCFARPSFSQLHLFAEGTISTGDYETHPAFSPAGDTLYFLRGLPDANLFSIYFSIRTNGKWSRAQIAPFSGRYVDADPFVTKDGKAVYFVSNRPAHPGDSVRPDWDIWKVNITSAGWGTPIHLESPVNTDSNEYFPTMADNGNLYFGSERSGGRGKSDLYVARPLNGKYAQPENLGDAINTPENEYEPYISPDENLLIFMTAYPAPGRANMDFYYSRRINGAWTKAQKLPPLINTSATEWGGKMTRDGKYFFFGSNRNIVTDRLPQRETTTQFEHRMHSAGNGLGDIYYIDWSKLAFNVKKKSLSNPRSASAK